MIVKNEERWIWYSIHSILDYVDELYIYDTGSTDETVNIIKKISNSKIIFMQHDSEIFDAETYPVVQNMLVQKCECEWILIVDGDEIWTEKALQEMQTVIRTEGDTWEFLINPFKNLLGDIYHFQEELAGKYHLGSYRGHISVRAINRSLIPELHVGLAYGQESFFDEREVKIQDRSPFRGKIMSNPFLHTTHLRRSGNANLDKEVMQRQAKYKYELGTKFTESFVYPKSFYLPRPELVAPAWEERSLRYQLMAFWQTPLKYLKRHVI